MAKRVYFAFDYEDVSDFRANVVRKHNFTGGVERAGYFDASIWEEAKKKDPATLKGLINTELESTSVTAVLIGTGTFLRRWVRYEIMKSFARGNRILGIHINGIKGKGQTTKGLGPNPFDYLSIKISADGKIATPMEWDRSQWISYEDLAAFALVEQPAVNRSKTMQLSSFLPVYDWVTGDGFSNFSTWIA